MLALFKHLALVMMMAVLPVQGLAAVIAPVCGNDSTPSSTAAMSDHRHTDKHDHDIAASQYDHLVGAGDFSSDHCGAGSAFAIPAILTEPAPAATAERGWFAAACRSGFIPEQPQRPPLV